jgi:hypothetical protein
MADSNEPRPPIPADDPVFVVGTRVRITEDGKRVVPDPNGDLVVAIDDNHVKISVPYRQTD